MKRAAIVLITIVFCFGLAFAEEQCEQEEQKTPTCPKTQMQASCMDCHTAPTFAVKEANPKVLYDLPNNLSIVNGDAYYTLTYIDCGSFKNAVDYMVWHSDMKLIIDIQSPGGSLFSAWRIKNLIDYLKTKGVRVETRCYGLAASAGFLIFCAGDDRMMAPMAFLMWHELITFRMLDVSSPADKEDEAKVLRKIQDETNSWIATRGNMTKEELDTRIRKKELWLSAKEAVDLGFATGILAQ